MNIVLNKFLDNYDIQWDNQTSISKKQELDKQIISILVDLGFPLYAIKDKLNLWRRTKVDMNKLYQKLAKLEQELVAAKTTEEKELIEEEIWEIQDEIDQMEADKYSDEGGEDY